MTSLCTEPEHYCAGCHPERFDQSPTPRHEGHYAVRFGDRSRGQWRVLVDGRDVTELCDESLCGPGGRVFVHVAHPPDGRALVHCPGHVCRTIIFGDVRIVPTESARPSLVGAR